MKNDTIVQDEVKQSDPTIKYAPTCHLSPRTNIASNPWSFSFAIIVVRLPALLLFLAMGGMFAIVGPWIILLGIQSIRMRPGWHVLGFTTCAGFLFLGVTAFLLPVHLVFIDHLGE